MLKKSPLLFSLCLITIAVFADEVKVAVVTPEATVEKTQVANFESFTGRVVRNKVRLRTKANKESAVVREINAGDMVGIVGEENEFYIVQPPRTLKGYVFRTFVLDNTVEGEKVNVRLHPDIEAPVIGRLHNGEKIEGGVSATNNKWLEINLPSTFRFYVAKEYVEKEGGLEVITQAESRQEEALHKLNAVFHYAKAEIQKSFEEISFDTIHDKFNTLMQDYSDLPTIVAKAIEANNLIEETYLQKKITFLESKNEKIVAAKDIELDQIQKITQLGQELKTQTRASGEASSAVLGKGSVANDPAIAERNIVWQSLEDSFYHLWAANHEGRSMEEFYKEAAEEGTCLTGVIESYTRPVKNRPGDFLLRNDSQQPIAFLYSTKIDLQDLVGKKVTLVTSSRPNNNFAFPAYFVLSVD